jgi:hypothetical protein
MKLWTEGAGFTGDRRDGYIVLVVDGFLKTHAGEDSPVVR